MNIHDERPEDEITTLPLRLRCGWCKRVLREGIEPESTGICSDCASKMRDAETVPAWKGSLGRLGKAQARLWHDAPLELRQKYLALVDAEQSIAQLEAIKITTPFSIPQADGHSTDDEQEQP